MQPHQVLIKVGLFLFHNLLFIFTKCTVFTSAILKNREYFCHSTVGTVEKADYAETDIQNSEVNNV
jgi:hypothetical protein